MTLFPVLWALGSDSDTDFDPGTLVLKEILAKRTDTPPQIDGNISDSVWNQTTIISDFFQTEPEDLTQPTEKNRR